MATLERPNAGGLSKLKRRISKFEIARISGSNSCVNPQVDFKRALQTAADDLFRDQKGLCLRCVKEGKMMVIDGNCGAESYESCSINDWSLTMLSLGLDR